MQCDAVLGLLLRTSRRAVPGSDPRYGGLRFAATPLRCSVLSRTAQLTALALLAAFKQSAVSQRLKRALRADSNPALLAATEWAAAGHRPPLTHQQRQFKNRHRCFSKGGFGQDWARLCGAEERKS